MPGSKGYRALMSGRTEVEVLENHWAPFWEKAEGNYALTEDQLRADFAAAKSQGASWYSTKPP